MEYVFILLVLFQIKHFICDYPLQIWPYMYVNKGTYGHFGGLLHTIIHMIGTFLIVVSFDLPYYLVFIDGVIHYHVDWLKVKINNIKNWKPQSHSEFWILLGLDQMLHHLTYIFLIWLALT